MIYLMVDMIYMILTHISLFLIGTICYILMGKKIFHKEFVKNKKEKDLLLKEWNRTTEFKRQVLKKEMEVFDMQQAVIAREKRLDEMEKRS